ncbi:MAG: hypothetical protein K2K99_01060 [Muribaculaceae bacterium]|nr:hypothetical protein [Muribaculaceae bacterium]
MKKIHLITLSACLILGIIVAEARTNAVALGDARVEVRIAAPDSLLDRVTVAGGTVPLFDNEMKEVETTLLRDGNSFTGSVPVDRLRQIGGVTICVDGKFIGGTAVVFSQDEPMKVEVDITPDGSISTAHYSGASDMDIHGWMSVATIAQDALCVDPSVYVPADKGLYADWQAVRDFQTTTAWPEYLRLATAQCAIPDKAHDWLLNSLKAYFASQCVVPYVVAAKEYAGVDAAEPPMESYSFLDSIDYSPEVFMLTPQFLTPRWLLGNILTFAGGGIEPIGDTPVKQWQKAVDAKLAPAIKKRTQFLLDLLSAMSYVQQIDAGTPLTDIQISNISEAYTDDIGKIILARNQNLK